MSGSRGRAYAFQPSACQNMNAFERSAMPRGIVLGQPCGSSADAVVSRLSVENVPDVEKQPYTDAKCRKGADANEQINRAKL